MQIDPSQIGWKFLVPPLLLLMLGIVLAAAALSRGRFTLPGYLGYFWIFLLVCVITDFFSFTPAVWLMALVSFRALREYFSLVDLRLEDRWGILGAYLSIPFMIYLIQIDWYGFFIVSIPVYVFIVVPFLVTLGDSRGRGSLLSIGAIDLRPLLLRLLPGAHRLSGLLLHLVGAAAPAGRGWLQRGASP